MYSGPFKWWVQSVMPLVFDESLSYYEVLAKLTRYIEGLKSDVEQIEKILGTIEGIEDVTEFTKFLENIQMEIGNLNNLSTQNKTDLVSAINEVALKASIAYPKPVDGIPEKDLSQEVRDKLNRTGETTKYIINNIELKAAPSNNSPADLGLGTYSVPSGGIPWDNLSQDVRDRIESGGSGEGGTKDYNELNNKPQINGHTLNAGNNTGESLGLGTYSKPEGGIPESDLSTEVQEKLNTSGGIADAQVDFTAIRDYEAGELLYINGVLYKTKVKILSGTTMIPGNNIEVTDISGEIESINSKIDAMASGEGLDSWSLKYSVPSGGTAFDTYQFFEYFNVIGGESYLFIATPYSTTIAGGTLEIYNRNGDSLATHTFGPSYREERYVFTPDNTGECYCTIQGFLSSGTAYGPLYDITLEYTQSQGMTELWSKVNEATQLGPRITALESLTEQQQIEIDNLSDIPENIEAIENDIYDLNADINGILSGTLIIKWNWELGRINGSGVPYVGDGRSQRTKDYIDFSDYSNVIISDNNNLPKYALTIFQYNKADETFIGILGGSVIFSRDLPYNLIVNPDYIYKFEWRNGDAGASDPSGLIGSAPYQIKYVPETVKAYVSESVGGKYALLIRKNLIDKSNVISGEYVRAENGHFSENENFWRTDYIEIEAEKQYTLRYINQVAFYDSSKIYISGVDGYSANTFATSSAFTSPENAKYIIVCGHISQLNTDQLEEGPKFTKYYPYDTKFVSNANIDWDWFVREYLTGDIKKESPNISALLQYTNSTYRIKLIGDSITHGVGGTGFAMDGDLIISKNGSYYRNPNGYCWANLLKEQLEAEYNCTVTNNAIRGRATDYYVENADILIGDDNDLVICMLGTNNRGTETNANRLVSDLQFLYDYCHSRGQKFILMASIPASNADEAGKIIHMDDVQHKINAVAQRNGCGFIDVYSQFYNYAWFRGIDFTTLLADGLHPNDSGYYVMYRIIAEALGIPAKIEEATWND